MVGEDEEEERGRNNAEENCNTVLLIVEGMDTLAEGVIRTSNPLRGSSLLTPALRTLTHLSRTHASTLAVMLVNTSGLGTASAISKSIGVGPTRPEQIMTLADQPQHHQGDAGGLHSVFSHPGTTTFLPTLLSRTLDRGIDTHILLSTVRGSLIAEVIRDRTGDSTGRWTVWDMSPIKC
jgi:hypothetical protein